MLVTLVAFLFIGFLHIPFSSGVYFIPIKSIEILNVTNCDRFREEAIVSNVTVTQTQTLTGPEAGKDGDARRAQTVAISFTNDVTLDEYAVVSISDMKPNRNSSQTIEWIRDTLYIDRHNLCDVLNNYLATSIFGKPNYKSRKKADNSPTHAYDEDNNTNNIEANGRYIGMEEQNQYRLKLCPIVAGHYVLPKFKWKSPPVTVPAIFLGYQKYMIEIINLSIDEGSKTTDNILMCKVVTVFLHPKKNYF